MKTTGHDSNRSRWSLRSEVLALGRLTSTLAIMAVFLFVIGECSKARERDQHRRIEQTDRRYLSNLEIELKQVEVAAQRGDRFDHARPFVTSRFAAPDRPASVTTWQQEIDWIRNQIDEMKTDVRQAVRARERVQRSMILPF